MTGDYTRFTFDARRRYSTVYMQQGRLYLDQDKNADSDIQRYANRTLAEDVLGRFGLSTARWPKAFLIGQISGPPEDLSIGEGRLYINGIQIEHFPGEGATYLKQPFLPLPPPLPAGDANVHLRVWDREITYIENPELLDVALGGNDTTTRLQTVWQLIVEGLDRAVCDAAPPLVSAGRLTTGAVAPPAPDDPCIVPPMVGYRGIENRTYKVMIFEGGPLSVARFMFSRDAGSVASAVFDMAVGGAQTTLTVNRIGRDPVLRFRAGDWVTVTDDHRELMLLLPEPAQVVDIDEANRRIVLDRPLPVADPTPFGANAAEIAARHTKIIRWDQTGALAPIDADGLITTGPGPIPLEDGIQVEFSMDPVGGEFLTGDCWLFAARTADASVEELVAAPPRRTFHVAQVAAAHGLGGPNPVIDDCRPQPQDEGRDCCCCEVTVSADADDGADFASLAEAVAAIPGIEPNQDVHVIICLLPGRHELLGRVDFERRLLTIRGCGRATILVARQGGAIGMLGQGQTVEHLAIIGETKEPLIFVDGKGNAVRGTFLKNQGPGPAIAGRVADLTIEYNKAEAAGGFDLEGLQIIVRSNRVSGGPVRFGALAIECRLEQNDILDSSVEGVILGDGSMAAEIDVTGNRIRRARRSGIASGFFDPEDEGRDGIIDGLRIIDNEIVDCITRDAVREEGDPPFAGIALGRVYDLVVHDNRILNNGANAPHPVSGVYVRHSRGADLSRNRIERNGRVAEDAAQRGVQAGIALMDARVSMYGTLLQDQEQAGFIDIAPAAAAHVVGNAVASPHGHALRIEGQGPIRVLDNRFQSRDVLGREGADESPFAAIAAFTATVFIVNLGLPSWLGTLGIALGFDMITTGGINQIDGDEVLGAVVSGGQTQFRGNQVRLDLTRPAPDVALANVLVIGLDDVVITDNQTEGIFSVFQAGVPFGATTYVAAAGRLGFSADLLMTDLFNFAPTTRQSDNGFMTTPLATMFSILSRGIVNHCTHNQTTSCISATGSSPKSRTEGNAVLWPHPVFCRDDNEG